ncbi:Imm52 family immunity protein [Xenorhabdus sp. PB30.3]|uniref:Imm52 family immunity protein n=1 Tax=Xenorhabdus sp. PB30.3 TaxID=2788941 RepID=UPI001E35BFC3|nr:Imm52 family immunity protein [Xenorhabdus sp. PB30.3]MCC8379084.1 immunity 52 family protein [Xenorhabdus sp. PB30.3]
MSEINLNIAFKENTTEQFDVLLDTLYFFLNELNKCDEKINAFYAQAESLEEALENKIITIDREINPEAQELIGEYLPYATGVWDGKDDKPMSLTVSEQNETFIAISAENHIGIYNKSKLVNFIKATSEKYTLQLFSVAFNVGDPIFPDRPAIGWMLYLPQKIEMHPMLMKFGVELISISTPLSTGTIIISKDNYNCMSKSDQQLSNDIEIALRDLNLLPLYSDVYKDK